MGFPHTGNSYLQCQTWVSPTQGIVISRVRHWFPPHRELLSPESDIGFPHTGNCYLQNQTLVSPTQGIVISRFRHGFPPYRESFLAVDFFPYMSGLLRKIFSELLSETPQGLCVFLCGRVSQTTANKQNYFPNFSLIFRRFFAKEHACYKALQY
jgi:hypothetical protein